MSGEKPLTYSPHIASGMTEYGFGDLEQAFGVMKQAGVVLHDSIIVEADVKQAEQLKQSILQQVKKGMEGFVVDEPIVPNKNGDSFHKAVLKKYGSLTQGKIPQAGHVGLAIFNASIATALSENLEVNTKEDQVYKLKTIAKSLTHGDLHFDDKGNSIPVLDNLSDFAKKVFAVTNKAKK